MKEGPGGSPPPEITIVGQGARLEGTVVSAGSLRIDGQVRGRIEAEGDVVLSPQSHVEADILATNATVAGRLTGNLEVKGRAELARGGRVEGTITSKTLVIAEGASFTGQSIMDGRSESPKPERGRSAADPGRTDGEGAGPEAAGPRPPAAGPARAGTASPAGPG